MYAFGNNALVIYSDGPKTIDEAGNGVQGGKRDLHIAASLGTTFSVFQAEILFE